MSRRFAAPAHLLALLIFLAMAGIASGILGVDASDLARLFHTEPLYSFLQAWPMKYEGVG